jgi:phosphoenolpyruvate---glycerone phosphotransferase subunit DhaL
MKGITGMGGFKNDNGMVIMRALITAIQEKRQYLSDIDGAIGDGDHGINMSKGFTMCQEELQKKPGNLTHGLKTLSRILLSEIGGSMGPLYGVFFKAMAKVSGDNEIIDAMVFGEMLNEGKDRIIEIGGAQVGDKTLIDVLAPAVDAYMKKLLEGEVFKDALVALMQAAEKGRDSTVNMVAKMGRSSRLGERSRGVMDAGAASCCLILVSMAESILNITEPEPRA